MKYFGSDGIRGKLTTNLNDKTLNKIAKAIVLFYNKNKLKKVLLVGNDTRLTSDYILSKLASTLLKNGIEIHNLNVCSSPCLAYTTKTFNYPLGLMISASHNPAEYNGIKFFNSFGEKVDDEFEINFENLMDKKISLKNNNFAKMKNVENLQENYINMLKNLKNFNFSCIFDCSNGGISHICKKIFPKHEKININPNGKNINLNAGCTHIEMLKSLCVKKQKIGFAFDGDGDRIHIVDKTGNILTGDEILFVLSKFFQSNNDICVGTIYTNLGLEKALNSRNITLLRSDVGDKNVIKLMKEKNALLGGEESGHIILKPFTNTGDGMLIAIIFANILELSKKTISELLEKFEKFHQVRKDLTLPNDEKLTENIKNIIREINEKISKIKNKTETNEQENNQPFQIKTDEQENNEPQTKTENTTNKKVLEISNIVSQIKNFESQGTKIIIRPSGTEPVIRLFAEAKNQLKATEMLKQVDYILQNQLGLFSFK